METGTLIIQKTSKGFAAVIRFERDGQTKTIPVLAWKPTDDKYHEKPCKFRRDKGQLVHLEIEDGTVLYPTRPAALPANRPGGQQGQGGYRDGLPVADLFDLSRTRLPKDVRSLNFEDIDNFHLKLNKGAFYNDTVTDRYGNISPLTYEKSKFVLSKSSRNGFLAKIRATYGDIDFRMIAQRQRQTALAYCNNRPGQLISCTGQTQWRMALGLGHESVYETAMTLHFIYGFPYVPASALKGVVRSYVIRHHFKCDEIAAIKDRTFCDIFGCPEEINKSKSHYNEARIGHAIFFDAMPLSAPDVDPDVMNPHYGDYYGSKPNNIKPPTDFQSPIPIPFLTVKNTAFQFMAGFRGEDIALSSDFFTGSLSEFLRTYLEKALAESGMGAKTAVGYGFFRVVNDDNK